MFLSRGVLAALAVFVGNGLAQPYIIHTIAGTDRLLDGSKATVVPLRDPRSIAADAAGGFYIADGLDNRIRHVDAQGFISTYAGTGIPGIDGDRGKAVSAELNNPRTIVLDSAGNMYIGDYGNAVVRRISPDGIINTIAGNGRPTFSGPGSALDISFSPASIALDEKAKILYIADDSTYRVLKMDLTTNMVTVIAGTGQPADPSFGLDGKALNVALGYVTGMITDSDGNLYLADFTGARVRKIDKSGNLTNIAGYGLFGYTDATAEGKPASQAVMWPFDVAFDNNGNLVVSDVNRNVIFRMSLTDGLIHLVAGNGNTGYFGDNGPALQAQLSAPRAVVFSASAGALFFADWGNLRIREIKNQYITTVAGTDQRDGGPATNAFLNRPWGVAADATGHVLVGDSANYAAREFTIGGNIGSVGQLNNGSPLGVAVDSAGNFYVTDTEPAVLKIAPNGSTTKLAGDSNSNADFTGAAVDTAGNVYVADYNNLVIDKISPAGVVSTYAGNGSLAASGDHGPAKKAGMDPFGVAVDSQQNVYVADRGNNRVRKITPDGIIITVAGTGAPGYTGDGGQATAADLFGPTGVAVDANGNLFICDRDNSVVRRVTPEGLISTIAGLSPTRYTPATGDGGPATQAQLDPWQIAVDLAGNLYVTDLLNDRVRELTPVVVTGDTIKAFSGDKQSGVAGSNLSAPIVAQVVDSSGDGVPGVEVTFAVSPTGAATVTPLRSITLNDGTVKATVLLGNTPGTVTITATAAGIGGKATFTTTITPPASATAPVITASGIVSAGLSTPAVHAMSPNAIATVFGARFAPAGTAVQLSTADLVNGAVPTKLAGVCVLVGGQRAPIFDVYPGQINFQVPPVAAGIVAVQVVADCDGTTPQPSNIQTVTVQAAAPEFFYFVTNANGHNPIAAIDSVSGAYIGAAGLVAGGSFTPAKPGEVVTLFGTGFGATNPSFGAGELPDAAAGVTANYSLSIGGATVDPASVLYVGVVGGNAGLYQVNFIVPQSAPDGDDAIVLTVNGAPSPAQAYITVAR